MNVLPKRVFISKLPEHIGKTDLESKFSHYGKVASVEVISRKNSDDQRPFAFVNLETSDEDLHRCIRDFANKKWKGEFLDVQVAKESFLTKLKREREEGANKKQAQTQWESKPEDAEVSHQYRNNFRIEPNNKRRKLYFDEQNESSGDEVTNYHLPVNKIVIKRSQKTSEDTIPDKEQPQTNNDLKADPKYIEANQKRIQSNLGMINQYKQQKLLIRSALSNLDGKAKNKIVFDADANEQNLKSTKKSTQLFNEDSNDEEDDLPDFALKEHFEGQEGQKLLQLQSRFKNDKRFVMNERFLENNEENANGVDVVQDEKQTQLNILEKVLGTKVTPKPKAANHETQKVMLRFDPEDPQHKAYELKLEEEQNTAIKKKKRKEKEEAEEVVVPEVSNTKFYKVADDLKNVFQTGNKPFSLLSTSNTQSVDADNSHTQQADYPINGHDKKIVKQPNGASFNDDSTDGDEEEEMPTPTTAKESATDRVRFWTEPFFFNEDDFRYQEGLDFIKRIGSQEGDDFLALRRNLKEVVRAKVRNVNRKNGMFKKKLGGAKKRMRIKRALKRS